MGIVASVGAAVLLLIKVEALCAYTILTTIYTCEVKYTAFIKSALVVNRTVHPVALVW